MQYLCNPIFYFPLQSVIVPGDNDIGGEGGDFRTPFKVHRFEQHFGNLTGLVNHKFVDFLKVITIFN